MSDRPSGSIGGSSAVVQGSSESGRGRRVAGGLAVSVASQALSSVTNLGLTVLLVAVSDPAELGRWVAVTSVYLLALTLLRSTVTEPMVAAAGALGNRSSVAARWRLTRTARRRVMAGAVVGTLAVGIAVGLEALPVALLALAIPPLLAQDADRYLAWARNRPRVVLGLDGLWLVISAALLAFAAGTAASGPGSIRPTTVVAAWAAGGLVAAVAGWWQLERDLAGTGALGSDDRSGPAPRTGPARDAEPDQDPQAVAPLRRLAWSQGLFAAAFNALPVVVAVLVSASAAGAVRTILLPFAPIMSLLAGIRVVTLPMMAGAWSADRASDQCADEPAERVTGQADAAVRRIVASAVSVASVGSLAVVVVAGLLPVDLLGPGMAQVRPYLVWGAVLCAQYVAAQFLADGLAVARGAERVVARRLATVALEWSGLLVGAILAGVGGLAVGWSIGLALAVFVWLLPWLVPVRDRP